MNILLTTACSLNCSYCFARSLRSDLAEREMTLPELETILSALDPCQDRVRLMGGEPTLHTRYTEAIRLIKTYGFMMTVFTNGLQAVLRQTEPDLPDRILVNLNDWTTYTSAQQDAICATLSAFGDRAGLGYTILDPAFDLSMHRRLILEENLQPVIRLGLAQPVLDGDNAYLQDENLPAAHQAVVEWACTLSEDHIRLSMDCGFMRCQFTDADIDTLVRAGTVLNFDCSPTLDVGPGLMVWRCYAFSSVPGVAWADFKDVQQLRHEFRMRDARLGRTCVDCSFQDQGWCSGGCLARQMLRDSNPSA